MDSKFYVRVRAYKKRNSGNQPLDLNSNVRPLYSPSELTLHRASCFITDVWGCDKSLFYYMVSDAYILPDTGIWLRRILTYY
jgi:hypothetical protein